MSILVHTPKITLFEGNLTSFPIKTTQIWGYTQYWVYPKSALLNVGNDTNFGVFGGQFW